VEHTEKRCECGEQHEFPRERPEVQPSQAAEANDHADGCMARHPGFGCTCEQIEFEDRQREVAAVVNSIVHRDELLARAADMIDPDTGPTGFTTEQRLDWLAKWREVTTR
jgi:hypothetical protein